ncbi:MAG: ISKra4 family transposase [Cytophagales bacterium]|nr:ISKra4 family transposase [Cytophagales bacterium]
MECRYLQEGILVRPFSESAGVKCRGYSLPLQRRMTDFGSDDSFSKACEKMMEHYGIMIPFSAMRSITEGHAAKMKDNEKLKTDIPDEGGVECVIGEVDGTMIPIVDTFSKTDDDGKAIDKRKTREVRWEEARLSIAHAKGSISPVFGATSGNVDEAGDQLAHCAILAGMDQHSKVHCVGDGAPWIADQVDRVFGIQASFLIDFYHVCDYLAAASKCCAPDDSSGWLKQQKERMKESNVSDVLKALQPHIEPDSVPNENAPVRQCQGYIKNRPGQFYYKRALEADLPIGSGEVESAHRYVIQRRLKIAGAWWKEDNAEHMLALRTLRSNNSWNGYWTNLYKKAA